MTYDEALEYIHGISWTFCKPGLSRISALCEALGHPERELRFVHIAGTNGKGSTSSMLESVLRAAGYKTGLYTSPYIYRFNERMRVMGRDIPDGTLAEITEYVKGFADALTDTPTEFELITAIAFEYFRRERCDVVILEAGMGGRLDSTNVIRNPLLSIITGIALDHTAFLGDTVEKIAAEKAGIIKDSAPVLYGGDSDSAYEVIRAHAAELGSEIYRKDSLALRVRCATLSGTEFDYKARERVKIGLLGLYQPKNAALVLDAVDILRERGLNIPEDAVYSGLLSAAWRARFEIIRREPLTIFDGAHNPEGIEVAVESIKHYFGTERVAVVTGVLRDKDYRAVAKKISEVAARVFTITPDNPRALPAEEYAELFNNEGIPATHTKSIAEALSLGTEYAGSTGCALFSLGSLYTYVDIINNLK